MVMVIIENLSMKFYFGHSVFLLDFIDLLEFDLRSNSISSIFHRCFMFQILPTIMLPLKNRLILA